MAVNIVDEIIKIIKDEWQRIPDALSLYVSDNLGEDIGAAAFRSGGSARRLRAPRNTRTGPGSLRQISGDLFRSTQPGGDGNISKFSAVKTGFEIEYAIDKRVIPYAYIHEYGGRIDFKNGSTLVLPARPYLAPAIEDFEREEIPKIFSRINTKIRKLF
jgi:phage gpG-like protein